MADTDPPNKVDDLKAPPDGSGIAPDADAFEEQVSGSEEKHHGEHEGNGEAEDAGFFRYRAGGVGRVDYGGAVGVDRHLVLLVHCSCQLTSGAKARLFF